MSSSIGFGAPSQEGAVNRPQAKESSKRTAKASGGVKKAKKPPTVTIPAGRSYYEITDQLLKTIKEQGTVAGVDKAALIHRVETNRAHALFAEFTDLTIEGADFAAE